MLSPVALDELSEIRRDLHAHPELRFEEVRTAGIVCDYLREHGYRPESGLAKTGVVATLDTGVAGPSIMLRADMDALALEERSDVAHASRHQGKMHACGHDGHTTMLLGAAAALSKNPPQKGIVRFVFQPAEEGGAGAEVMIREGFLERFPVDACYGLHNWPGLAAGQFGVRAGAVMAGGWRFAIKVQGRGSHAAQPHKGCDVVVAASAIVQAAQTLVARRTDPTIAGVVSICMFHAGSTDNILPSFAELAGTIRALDESVLETLKADLEQIAQGIACAYGAEAEVHYHSFYPVTVNAPDQTDLVRDVIRSLNVPEFVSGDLECAPSLASEDFAFFLRRRPGVYTMLGNGETSAPLHSPDYDFNDSIIVRGIAYWSALAAYATSYPQ